MTELAAYVRRHAPRWVVHLLNPWLKRYGDRGDG
jgi:hypothetical protein